MFSPISLVTFCSDGFSCIVLCPMSCAELSWVRLSYGALSPMSFVGFGSVTLGYVKLCLMGSVPLRFVALSCVELRCVVLCPSCIVKNVKTGK